jgi:hypothetical protein
MFEYQLMTVAWDRAEALLNKAAGDGWRLVSANPTSDRFFLMFLERETTPPPLEQS